MNRRVVRANYKGDLVTLKLQQRMGLVGRNSSGEPVADWAYLDADILLCQEVSQMRILAGCCSMANTICTKQFHCCPNVVHATGFACMYGDPESEPIFRLPKQ